MKHKHKSLKPTKTAKAAPTEPTRINAETKENALSFRWESLINLVKEGLCDLTRQAWDESRRDSSPLEYDPDWTRYGRMEHEGILRLIAVRDSAGILVGYAGVIVTFNLYDRTKSCAVIQDYYLLPENRRGFTAGKLFWFIEEQLKIIKVVQLTIVEQPGAQPDEGGRLFEQLGYKSYECVWTKALISERIQ